MDTALHPDDVLPSALRWHRAGQGAALVTVIDTWGSAPRPTGSQMVVSGAGDMAGSVSGGCVEAAVVIEALSVIAGRAPRIVTYAVSDGMAFAAGLACGGTLRLMIEPVGADALGDDILGEIVAARTAHRALAVVTDTVTWARQLVRAEDDPAVADRLRSDRSGLDAQGRFIAVHNPPLRLIVVGAVHIAQNLLPIARACGYACTLIDPRSSFGAAARFPGERIVDDWPDTAVAGLGADARTAIVTLTHDAKLDDPALITALRSDAFYIGCLGSRRTHAARLERLRTSGIPEADLARLHAPVGLAIGARTPGEIAVSILAQMTQVLRAGA